MSRDDVGMLAGLITAMMERLDQHNDALHAHMRKSDVAREVLVTKIDETKRDVCAVRNSVEDMKPHVNQWKRTRSFLVWLGGGLLAAFTTAAAVAWSKIMTALTTWSG